MTIRVRYAHRAPDRFIEVRFFIITKVDMEGKLQTIEALKQEYKGKRKMLENEAERQMEQLRAKEASEKELKKALELNQEKMASLEEDYVETMRELKDLEPLRIVSEHVYQTWSLKFGHLFEASIGAEAVYDLLKAVDLKKTIKQLETELVDAFGAKKDKLVRRVKLLRVFKRLGLVMVVDGGRQQYLLKNSFKLFSINHVRRITS